MKSSSGKQPSFFVKLPVCWTAAMCEVCLRRDFSPQHISKHIKATSCLAGRHIGSVNGWTCEQQVMIVVEPWPLRGGELLLPVIHPSAQCSLHMVIH